MLFIKLDSGYRNSGYKAGSESVEKMRKNVAKTKVTDQKSVKSEEKCRAAVRKAVPSSNLEWTLYWRPSAIE
jgi:hypothetical protein